MDTKDFDKLSADGYKEKTRENWTSAPCGSNYAQSELMTEEFFEEVEQHRYSSHPWILEAINGFDIKGKKVLEIGFGMGTDHVSLARRGAVMYGIDLTPRHHEICRARLDMYGLRSELTLGDAENLPYPDDSFDFVYSLGVVHHSPDTQKIITEIHRTLKPGGKCYIAVYNRNSVFFWLTVWLLNYVIIGGYRKRSLKEQISLVEYPNNNPDMVIRLYRKKEFAALFSAFTRVKGYVRHLIPVDLGYLSKYFKNPTLPRPLFTGIGNRFGWYIIIEAEK